LEGGGGGRALPSKIGDFETDAIRRFTKRGGMSLLLERREEGNGGSKKGQFFNKEGFDHLHAISEIFL